jgi:hypothetical protein
VLIRLTPLADSEVFANHELHQQDPDALGADDPAFVVVQHYEPRMGSLRVPASAAEAQELRQALFDWGNALDQHVDQGLKHSRDAEAKRVYRAVRDGFYKAAEKIDADHAGRQNPHMPRHPRPVGPRGGTSEPQSILVPADVYTPAQAKRWVEHHGFKVSGFEPASERTSRDGRGVYHHFRQFDPDRRHSYRTIPFGDSGIMAVIEVPKRASRR